MCVDCEEEESMSCNGYLESGKIPRRYFLYLCNNMRKMHGLPMRRRRALEKYERKYVIRRIAE